MNDVKFIMKLLEVGKFLGINVVHDKKNNTIKTHLSRAYNILLLTGAIAISCISIGLTFKGRIGDIQFILEFLSNCSSLFFIISCFTSAFSHRKNWTTLLRHLATLDEKLIKEGYEDSSAVWLYPLKLYMLNFIYVAVNSYEVLTWFHQVTESAKNSYILSRIALYYQFFTTLLSVSLVNMLEKRYDFLTTLLENVSEKKIQFIIVSQNRTTNGRVKISAIRDMYAILFKIIRNYNVIFGWKIFLAMVCTVLVALDNLNFIMNYIRTHEFSLCYCLLLNNLVFATAYMVSRK